MGRLLKTLEIQEHANILTFFFPFFIFNIVMSSIGEILREARKKKGISEEVAAKALKMKLERVRDLEENRYEQFSAHVYIRSFLRHYTEYLGMDSGPIIQRFLEEYPAPESKPVFEITEEQRANSPVQRHLPAQASPFFLTTTGKTVLTTAVLILVVAISSTWWIMKNPIHSQSTSTENSADSTSETQTSKPESWEKPSPALSSVPVAPLTLSTNSSADSHRNP